jgi:anti-anti-sigma factor
MTIEKKTAGSTTELSLNGWMDTQSAPDFEKALAELAPETEHLILNLQDLEYTSSAGVRQIVAAHKKMNGEMTMRNVRPEVVDVVTMTGLAKKLHFEEESGKQE